jgi:hypothetical protein
MQQPSHTSRAKALSLIKERSYREGDFVLASGKTSKFYLDMKPTMFHPDGANLLAELVLEKLANVNVDYVGGMAVGAIPLVTAVTVRWPISTAATSSFWRTLPRPAIQRCVLLMPPPMPVRRLFSCSRSSTAAKVRSSSIRTEAFRSSGYFI